jgi:hypothetical protein
MKCASLVLAMTLAAATAAGQGAQGESGQGADVVAQLDTTEGLARAGAYVPVRLKVTNRTDSALDAVEIDSGGPVRVAAPLAVAPGASGEAVVPVFYAGGDLVLRVVCLSGGAVRARATLDSLKVSRLPDDTALVAVETAANEPEGGAGAALWAALGDDMKFRYLPADDATRDLLARCGMLDAIVTDRGEGVPAAVAAVVRAPSGGWTARRSPYPRSVHDLVQPGAYRLVAADVWPGSDRERLWFWGAVFALAVLLVGLFVPRRRAVLAVIVMAVLAAAAMAVLWQFGGLRGARIVEARVWYGGGGGRTPVERFVRLELRGGAVGRYAIGRDSRAPLPVVLVPDSDAISQAFGTLHLGDEPRFVTRTSGVILHFLGDVAPAGEPAGVRVAEVHVRGGECVAVLPAEGTAEPVGACAAAWRQSPDPAVAFAGRSLAWWAADRQQGEGAALLFWVRDEADAAADGAPAVTRSPALIVRRLWAVGAE